MNQNREIIKDDLKKIGRYLKLKSNMEIPSEMQIEYEKLHIKYSNALVKLPIKNSQILIKRYINEMPYKELERELRLSRQGIIDLVSKSLNMLINNLY